VLQFFHFVAAKHRFRKKNVVKIEPGDSKLNGTGEFHLISFRSEGIKKVREGEHLKSVRARV
jgi:hypothetical protein